jgi:hypothetical protein
MNLQIIFTDTSDESESLQIKLQILLIDTGDAYISISVGETRNTFDTF